MRTLLGAVSVALLAACGDGATPLQPSQKDRTPSQPQMSFAVTDDPATPGFLYVAGTVTGGLGTVSITSTRYGSVCADDVTATDDVTAGRITLNVTYRARADAICPAVIRAITYHAHITAVAPGEYDVTVVQTSPDGNGTTTFTEHVKVS